MGQPHRSNSVTPQGEEPGEVKHLSTRRKRNRRDTLSSGERKGHSPNLPSASRQALLGEGLRDSLEVTAETSQSYKAID